MKKFVALLVSLLLIIPMLVSAPVLAQEPIEIPIWQHGGIERDILLLQIEEFNASQSEYRLALTEIPGGIAAGSTFNDAVNAAALAGELPCILDLDGPNLYNYAWAGFLIPLDDYVTDEFLADYMPSLIAQGTYNGHLYALGQFDSGVGIATRKSLLEAAGVRIPEGYLDTWTLDEFNDVLAKMQALPDVSYALDLKMNYGPGEWFTYGFSPVLQSFGGDLIDRETYMTAEGVLNGPEAVAAMEWLQSIFVDGYTTSTPPDDNEFVNGKAAMAWFGPWMYTAYKEAFGDDLIVLPLPDFGTGAKTGMGAWAWGITSKCEHPDAAWSFVEYMLEPDQVLRASNHVGTAPGRLSALAQSEIWNEEGDLRYLSQQLLNGIAFPRPITPAYPTITVAFFTAMDNIINGADVQDELDKAVDAIDRVIAENDGFPNLE